MEMKDPSTVPLICAEFFLVFPVSLCFVCSLANVLSWNLLFFFFLLLGDCVYPHFIHILSTFVNVFTFCKCVYILPIRMVVLAFNPFYDDLTVIFVNNCVLK